MSPPTSDALNSEQRATLGAALDALLPPSGSFPAPSETDVIEAFILHQLPVPGAPTVYPGIDVGHLVEMLDTLAGEPNMTAALQRLEREAPERFQALWALSVFGYYSRPEVTAAIQRDLACDYHGAPLPRGYAHVIAPWDAHDPLQMPATPAGRYMPTDEVRRVDLGQLEASGR